MCICGSFHAWNESWMITAQVYTLKAGVNALRMLWDPVAQVTFVKGQVHKYCTQCRRSTHTCLTTLMANLINFVVCIEQTHQKQLHLPMPTNCNKVRYFITVVAVCTLLVLLFSLFKGLLEFCCKISKLWTGKLYTVTSGHFRCISDAISCQLLPAIHAKYIPTGSKYKTVVLNKSFMCPHCCGSACQCVCTHLEQGEWRV